MNKWDEAKTKAGLEGPISDVFDQALYNGEVRTRDAILSKFGITEEFNAVNAKIQEIGEEVWSRIEGEDRLGRTIDQLSPPSFGYWDENSS